MAASSSSSHPAPVGVIANPASGRDIRRLVAGGSVVDNGEKGAMVFRLMVGLEAAGVRDVIAMPAGDGLIAALRRRIAGREAGGGPRLLPALEVLDFKPTNRPHDTVDAVARMLRRGVGAIVVLGGDGTHRVVAEHCDQTAICALSSGTNNVFPELRESTLAGLAVGAVVTGSVGLDTALVREPALRVATQDRTALALVDVATTTNPVVGSRAVWQAGALRELVVTVARPATVGLAAIAGQLGVRLGRGEALHVRLGNPATAPFVLDVPVSPGLVTAVGIVAWQRLGRRQTLRLDPGTGSVTLDGEREFTCGPDDEVTVQVTDGPWRVDVDATLAALAERNRHRLCVQLDCDRPFDATRS